MSPAGARSSGRGRRSIIGLRSLLVVLIRGVIRCVVGLCASIALQTLQEVLVLIIGLREVVDAIAAQCIEIIIRLRRIERRTDGRNTGVGDRPGGQARIL